MSHRLLASAATATLILFTTTAATAQAPDAMTSDQGWASIKRCAQEDTERARHTCLDRVLRDAGLLTKEMSARQQRRAFGLEEKAERAPVPTAGAAPGVSGAASAAASAEALNRRAAESAPAGTAAPPAASPEALNRRAAEKAPAGAATPTAGAAAQAAEPAPSDRLDVELAKVEKAASGRLFVTTTDGAVWLQIETVDMPLPPVAGDHMSIRKGSLGGYRCTIASTHLTYRCARNR